MLVTWYTFYNNKRGVYEMDAPQTPTPVSETAKVETPVVSSGTVKTSKKKLPAKKLLMVLGALVLLAGSAYGGYYWRDMDAKKDNTAQEAKITALKKQVASLETANKATTDEATTSDTAVAEETSVQPTATQLESIEASISSGNTAALEGRMADSVMVIIAASEGVGARTPTEAIGDIDYVIDLGATWDFALSAATLTDYADGDYAQYFPEGAFVGKSSEDKVISFIFDSSAKIKTVFMSVSSDLL